MIGKAAGVASLILPFVAVLFALVLGPVRAHAADPMPAQLDDGSFWKLIADLSEPNGEFQSENLLSNETDFPIVMSTLKSTVPSGGVYLGVGPEQNFNYIAAIRPRMAIIIDIRRQNMLELLMYKTLFELSPTRADFVARLFSRKRPAGLDDRGRLGAERGGRRKSAEIADRVVALAAVSQQEAQHG